MPAKLMLDELQTIRDRVETIARHTTQPDPGFLILNYVLGVTVGHISHRDLDDFGLTRKLAGNV